MKYLLFNHELFKVKDLSLAEKLVLCYLWSFKSDKVYITNDNIANVFDLSTRYIEDIIANLIKLEYIKTYYEYTDKYTRRYIWVQKIPAYHFNRGDKTAFIETQRVIKQLRKKWDKNKKR